MEAVFKHFLDQKLKLPASTSLSVIKSSLCKDSFDDGPIMEGFNIFSLLNQLAEILPDMRKKLE